MLDIDKIKEEKSLPELASFRLEFLSDRLTEIAEMQPKIDSSDFDYIKKTAHNWKGFSEPYGFKYLGDLARRLEQDALASDQQACAKTFNTIKEYMAIKKELVK